MPEQWPVLSQTAWLSSHGRSFTQQGTDSVETVLLVLRYALPFLLAVTLLIERMFAMLGTLGDHMSGWANLGVDLDDILLTSVKAKRTRRRLRNLAEQRSATRPRRWLLLLPLVVLTLASCIDGLAVLLTFVISTEATLPDEEIWPIFVAICCYAYCSVKYYVASDEAASRSMLLRTICGISLVLNTFGLGCGVALLVITHHLGVRHGMALMTSSLKVVASLALALAYVPRFGLCPGEGLDCAAAYNHVERGHRPNINTDQTNEPDGDDGDDDDNDDDDDDDETKRRTPYDWPAIAFRLRRILPLILPRHSRLAYVLIGVCILLQIIINIAQIFQPRQFGYIVNDLAAGRAPWRNLFIWATMRAVMNHGGIVAVLRRSLWRPISNHIARNMDILSFSHVLGLGMKYHSNKKTGDVISALSRGDSVAEVLDVTLFFIVPMLVNMAGSVAVLASQFGPGILCIVVTTGVGYVGLLSVFRKRSAELRAEYVDHCDNKAAMKNESITNVDLVKYFGTEPYEINRYSKSLLRAQKADWECDIYEYTFSLLEEGLKVAGTVAGALLVANQIRSEHLDIGIFVMFLTYINAILGSLEELHWGSQWTNRVFTDTDKLMDILQETSDILDRPDAEELLQCKGHIEFKNVSLVYDESKGKKSSKEPRKALDNVSFIVEPGQHVALVGETGAGKSTIFKLLYRFFEPQEGSIRVEGRDIRDYTQRSLRQALGVVQQEGQVFNDSIFANIKYGDIAAPDEKVMAAAKVAQIHEKIVEWPKGYQTVVGERGLKLSGGEKQRVNIARTILKNPKVLLLDEATSALDSNTEKAIQGQLRELTRGKTTIAIAHRLSTIAHADKIIVLDKGRLVETGTHEELVKIEGGFYKKLWETQTSMGKSPLDEDSSM